MIYTSKSRSLSLRALISAAAVVAACGLATPAHASSTGVIARYGTGSLNLAQSWGSAQSCVVTKAGTTCYASNAEADAAIGAPIFKTPNVAASPNDCVSGYLCLWSDTNGNGRRLQFRDESWQSLVPYGFDHQTSSWRNNQGCSDQANLGNGQGGILQLNACTYASSMGSWDNQAVDVHG